MVRKRVRIQILNNTYLILQAFLQAPVALNRFCSGGACSDLYLLAAARLKGKDRRRRGREDKEGKEYLHLCDPAENLLFCSYKHI
jgi:hypothetical protein